MEDLGAQRSRGPGPRRRAARDRRAGARAAAGGQSLVRGPWRCARRAQTARWHLVRLDAADIGIAGEDDAAPAHTPFAAVLGCSDARVPAELVLGRAAGDLFVVRVAGNVPGYLVDRQHRLRGRQARHDAAAGRHRAHQLPGRRRRRRRVSCAGELPRASPPSCRCARSSTACCRRSSAPRRRWTRSMALRSCGRPGYRNALVELSVILNSALTANVLRQTFAASARRRHSTSSTASTT